MGIVRVLARLLQRSTTTVPSRYWYKRTLSRAAVAGATAGSIGIVIASKLGKPVGDVNDDDGDGDDGKQIGELPICDEELPRALLDDHPDTVQVRRIAYDLIDAARDDEVCGQWMLSERTGYRVGHGAAE
ncbi:hypothetical protein E2562_034114 [Oryza meyeriana var. granulata]|uniref:Uncharacterized protein n=1 Tax=Oryza meyeriana var. granulata TaxID=110450 RepID=A0A6G1E587_9ORYZ|nr:hypothetical protein E2562_034114 [Oryza meyeriana var. granulata]